MDNKILILQSASRTYQEVRQYLREKYPDAKIDVLTTKNASLGSDSHPEEGTHYQLESENFHPSNLRGEMLSKLKSEQYQLAITLYNNINSYNYLNVEKTALKANPQKAKGIGAFCEEVNISRSYIYKRRVSKCFFDMMLLSINSILAIEVFVLTLFGYLCHATSKLVKTS